MDYQNIKTFGQLKASGYVPKKIKDELRENLIQKIRSGQAAFEGIHGFENTVIPELERAILSRHNINLLGLRGQAKTRLARLMVKLLDEFIPYIEGSEINDDPFSPISRFGRDAIAELGDNTPIAWLHRDDRFFEKLATPDVTVADLIGDVDPIKAANLKLSYADERVLHFGMIPRANRCIFVINELPDLQARIQVALFNILQEGDIQIRGFKLRLPLDINFIFTANPEDYTNRGSIVTPLKDRIGSQILTHYPEDIETARRITEQEARFDSRPQEAVYVPSVARDLLEQLAFEARESEFIDPKSGVSARMSITAFQNLLSTAERRALLEGKDTTTVRLMDFMGVIPAVTGKVELVYEGEQEGAAFVAQRLIDDAVKTIFSDYFPRVDKLEKQGKPGAFQEVTDWFLSESGVSIPDDAPDADYKKALDSITPLAGLIEKFVPDLVAEDRYFWMELLLWGLVSHNKISRDRVKSGLEFKDNLGSYIDRL
ncbi:AAA family ATPase [Flavobacterium silvaticum]|uniref:AAA domain-containing protein n=1 Tax=Flavobacterium silvaticum TaxID=1852020 RepID=A0A972JHA2_9FLAO|nr:AAA family ATPase [Flavobacterium silvaticum]NMH26908.1 AAA domain-containing protein [Flavobacterium silvaticum]